MKVSLLESERGYDVIPSNSYTSTPVASSKDSVEDSWTRLLTASRRQQNLLWICSSKVWSIGELPYNGKLSREKSFANWWKYNFRGENFRGLLAFAAPKDMMPQNSQRKLSSIAKKQRNWRKFSPSKVFHYTVCYSDTDNRDLNLVYPQLYVSTSALTAPWRLHHCFTHMCSKGLALVTTQYTSCLTTKMWVLTQDTLFGNCFLGDSIPTYVLILFVQTQLWHQLSAMGFCPSGWH